MNSNVCIIATAIPPRYAGGARRMLKQAKYIAKQGYKITLITNTPNHDVDLENLSIKLIKLPVWYENKKNNGFYLRIAKTIIYQPVIIINLFKLLKKSQFKIIHLTTSLTRLSLYSIIIAKLKGIKIINSTTLFGHDGPITIRRERGKILHYIFFSLPDAIVNNSPLVAETFKMGNIPLNKIHLIPNPVDTDIFKPESNQEKNELIRKKLGLSDFKYVLLTVSVLHKRKNIIELIRVFQKIDEKVNDCCLAIAGPINRDSESKIYYEYLISIIHKYKLNKKVIFLGGVNDVNELMNASDVFVFASKREGMPNVLLEAMSSGMAIVTRRIPKTTDILFQDNNGIVIDNEAQFAEKLIELLNNTKLKNKLANNARQTALRKFSNQIIMKKYINLYKSVSNRCFIKQ